MLAGAAHPRLSPDGSAAEVVVVSKSNVLANLLQASAAVVLGNVAYFMLEPSLPPAARHRLFQLDLGLIVDFWFCLVAYGLIRTARRWK
jgi:hypothetical protein